MKIKHSNWFAAGPEVERALRLLSDGAFKLYLHLCLTADRGTGRVSVSFLKLARHLKKSRRSIATYIAELTHQGVCRLQPALNQHQCNEIEVCDEFWPYAKMSPVGVHLE